MIRKFAERLSRGLVLKRRLSAEFGRRPFLASPDSALSLLKPGLAAFEDLATACRKLVQPGHCVWDIGGNLGFFSLMASHLSGKEGTTVCVEPDPFLASLIQRSVLLPKNSDRSIHVLCAAMAAEQGISEFLIASRGRSSNSLAVTGGRSQAGGIRYRQYVPTFTLDTLLDSFPPPDVLKIDVEGAEDLVLKGATRLLQHARPALYIEVGAQKNAQVTSILKDAGYDLFDAELPDEQLAACAFNTIAVPQDLSEQRLAA